jgi:hypothetical protein
MTTGTPAQETAQETRRGTLHDTSLAVWDIPTAAAGERFAVKIGAKSTAGCTMAGCRIDVLDGAGAVVASGRLGASHWPGTDGLHWAEVELDAPAEPGRAGFSACLDAGQVEPPHADATLAFSVSLVAAPEHTVTVKVTADGSPLEQAYVRLGPYRAITDATGLAAIKAAKGRYELVVWKTGYDAPVTPLAIGADAAVTVEACALPEDDPDSHWTA